MSADHAPNTALRRIGPWTCLGLVVVLLVSLIAALLYSWHAAGARRAADEIAKIRDRGEPATADEMNAFYERPPESRDCTELWIAALQPLQGGAYQAAGQGLPFVSDVESVPPGSPWPGLVKAEEYLLRHQRPLSLMHQAADRGGAARYPVDFNLGMAMLLPYVQHSRDGARMLALEAHVRAHRGDAAGAADSIHAMFELSGALENEPILVSQLVRMAIDGIARRQIEDLLPHVDFSDDALRRWRADLQSIDYDEGLRRALCGERVFGLVTFQNPGDLEAMGMGGNVAWRFTNQGDLAVYLEYMNRMVDAAGRPWPAARDEAAAVDADLKSLVGGNRLSRLRYVLTANLMPALHGAVDAVARGGVDNDAADAALAAELFRRRHGRLPENLGELVPDLLPAVPLDRFNGQPLRFVIRDGDCLIYSVGQDGLDGGGNIDDTGNGAPADAGFRLRAKPAE